MQVRRRGVGHVLMLALVASWVACGGGRPISPSPADPDPASRQQYVIGVQDYLQITVWRNDELNVKVPVRTDGKISVPLVDDIQAEGLTAMELKEVITRELSEFITAPDVTIVVLEERSRAVSLIGAVVRTGRIPLSRDTRVLDVIVEMGGFAPFADKSNVQIVRRMGDGTEETYQFDYEAYTKGTASGTNIVLRNGDTIIVSE